MMSRLPEWRFVEAVWIDSSSDGEWTKERDLPEALTMTTRGWLVKETENAITLAGTFYDDGGTWMFGEFITIPRVALTKKLKGIRT